MLCTSADHLPEGADWVFEEKWDGCRALLHVTPTGTRVQGRDSDLTAAFPDLAALRAQTSAVLDGEVVALDADGTPDFARLSRRLHGRQAWLVQAVPVVYVAFDCLGLNGTDLTRRPWTERRQCLAFALATVEAPAPLRMVATYADGPALWQTILDGAGEGVVAKRTSSPYQPGRRSPDWRKIKTFKETTVTVDAYEPNPAGITAIRTADGFRVQVAGTEGRRLQARLDTAPQTINIQYLEQTENGRYRMPTYRGLEK